MNAKTMMTTVLAALLATAAQAITSEEIAAALDVDPSVGTFSGGDSLPWRIDTDSVHKGTTSMRSPSITHNQSSELLTFQLVLNAPSVVEFWYRSSSESCDPLTIILDGAQIYRAGGVIGWAKCQRVLESGVHVYTFQYAKDGSVNTELDSVFIDDLSITPIFEKSSNVIVSNISCAQRTPWNGKIDIDYTVACDKEDADIWIYPVGYDKDTNKAMAPRALEGEGVNAPVKAGTHRMTWTVTDDYPNFNSTAFTVKMTALIGGAPYMVIDLSGGVDALSYPVTYLSSVPEGGWGDEYKTTKMVLRLIPSGSFMMGSPTDEYGRGGYETLHRVYLRKPFYIGVFECTQKQYQLVMGSTPSSYKGDARPVENVAYTDIRGTVNGAGWPTHNQVDATSFMGRLRSKVNMQFDLPTEAQWEFACRAGTSSALYSGKAYSDSTVKEVARCTLNTGDGKGGYNAHTKVGLYLDNLWGLYDSLGNVWELCRDFWPGDLGSLSVIDPAGATGGDRIIRGGSFVDNTSCRSACRGNFSASGRTYNVGFRVYCSPVAQ